jgi:Ca2+-binding EF-hand superfamily protein
MASHEGLPAEVAALSDADLRAFREAYEPFDGAKEGFIVCADIPMAFRALSLSISDSELRDHLDSVARGQTRITFIG